MMRILLTVLLMFAVWTVEANELLERPTFEKGDALPALADWKIDPQVGGGITLGSGANVGGVTLQGNRFVDLDGQQKFGGRLIKAKRMEVIPGRSYLLRVEARGNGHLLLGAVEFPDKHTPVRLPITHLSFPLESKWQTVSWQFTPSDAAMFIAPFFQMEGWGGHVDLRNPSLTDVVRSENLSVTAEDFVFNLGEPVRVRVRADHSPIKLLVYGPGGVPPGPGGAYGGADAWVDHFQSSLSVEMVPGTEKSVALDLPPSAREGFYRVVAVSPETGQSATAGFCVYPQSLSNAFRTLASRINLSPGSRLIFLGDSLTDFFRGRNYVDLVTRAIAQKYGDTIEVINAGVGGDTIKKIAARLTTDVIAKKPTHVFIFEGANDCKRTYDPQKGLAPDWILPQSEYATTYREVLKRLKEETDAAVFIMTMVPGEQRILAPYREHVMTFEQRKNFFCLPEETARVVALQKQMAEEYEMPVIDTHARFQAFLENKDAPYLHVDDGVHLSEYGNREVALSVLEYLANASSKDVSD